MGSDLGAQKGPKMGPKTDPKRTKIEVKNEDEKINFPRASWGDLGTIWGHFCAPLEVKNHQKTLENVGSRKKKTHFSKRYGFERRLGPNLGQLGRPKGSKMEPKREPRRSKKREEK